MTVKLDAPLVCVKAFLESSLAQQEKLCYSLQIDPVISVSLDAFFCIQKAVTQ